jgi:drug/metabolite transporter (DMT)-like permease
MSIGVKSIFIATLFFAGMNVFVKLLSHLPVAELTFFRAIFTFSVCYFLIKRKGLSVLGSRRPILFFRGLFGSTSLILFFYSLQKLPLATATLVHYITPFFTTFFGFLFLGERFRKIQWLFLFICFSGILITQSSNTNLFELNVSNLGLLAGLGCCIMSAAAYSCIRKIGTEEDPNVILIYFSSVTIPASLIVLWVWGGFIWPTALEWFYLFCMGALTQAGQYYMTLAYQNEDVGKIAIFTNMGIIYAIVNGMVFFNEIPTAMAWFGIAIVVIGLLLNMFFSHKNSKTLNTTKLL